MAVIAVKNYCVKNGRRYGPYPRDPEMFYLYRVSRVEGKVVREYLGRGSKAAARKLGKEVRNKSYTSEVP